ncbi:MAG TPA: hypothetical protein VGP13_03425 [Candidatus Paceibacterota bacterium]|jgi:hypothetical protein|nr:hypothetical protein [Candidatus Paceibacterota bacterium]
MSKEMTVIALGVLVVITPFLGVPGSWKTAIFVIAGLGIAGVGFLLRGEALARSQGQGDGHFVENEAHQNSQNRHDHGLGSLN